MLRADELEALLRYPLAGSEKLLNSGAEPLLCDFCDYPIWPHLYGVALALELGSGSLYNLLFCGHCETGETWIGRVWLASLMMRT